MEEIRKKLQEAVEELFGVKVEPMVTVAPENTGADYASNVAMQLAKVVHRAPMVIAEQIVQELEDLSFSRISSLESASAPSPDAKSGSVRSSTLPRTSSKNTSSVQSENGAGFEVSIAAPGFLNFKINDAEVIAKAKLLAEDLQAQVRDDSYHGKMVVAEFSDPNPFKVLHVGHLYTSIVGDSISRLLEFAGGKVVRANFGGDVGLHVAKTLYAILAMMVSAHSSRISSSDSPVRGSSISNTASLRASNLPRTSSKMTADLDLAKRETEGFEKFVDGLSIEDIAKCYVEGTRAYDEDEEARAEITRLNKEIYRINAEDLHDSELAQLYWRGRELSYEYFDDFYAKIGVKFDKYYPESSVAGRGLKEVRAHTGTTYEESDGAVVYNGEKVGLHTRVFINREGVPTYEAKDVGLIFTKWDDWHFDESVVVTGNEQSDYMKVVLASVSEYAPQLVDRTRHLTHGLVKLPGNVKMSSRKGNFLKAVDVLQMVEDQLKEDIASDRIADNGHSKQLNGAEEGKTDSKVLLAAIKYAFLKYKMGGDIVFDPQESVSTTGNSGVYLLYSAVRAKKILAKESGKRVVSSEEQVAEEKTFEKSLCKKLVQYKDVLSEAVKDKAPHKICSYLYEVAQEFSRFYEHVKVAGNEREAELRKIVAAYLVVMEHGLGLLGIEVPEEM